MPPYNTFNNPFLNGGQLPQTTPPVPVATPTPEAAPAKEAPAASVLAFQNGPASTPTSAARPATPMNSLSRGAPAGFSSGFGGPVKVGGGSSRAERTLQRLARRGNASAAGALYSGEQRAVERDSSQGFTREMADRQTQLQRETSALDFQNRSSLHEDGQQHDLDVLKFQDGARTKERQAEIEANKGVSVQPLDPNDPSKGIAVFRGNGELFNLLPGQKPEAGMREYPDGIVQFPGDSQPYKREDKTAPFRGVPFQKPTPEITYTPLDFQSRGPQPQVTSIPGDPIIDPITKKPTAGPERKVVVDPTTGKAKPVVVEGEQPAGASNGMPSWDSWLNSNKAKK